MCPIRPSYRRYLWRASLLACLLLLACQRQPRPNPQALGHEAYIWQHRWGPETATALHARPTEIQTLHVLAQERAGRERRAVPLFVDVTALAASGADVVAVQRIDGTAALDNESLVSLVQTVTRWQSSGVQVRAVEVDYDCPTAQLPAYTAWLREQRKYLRGLKLYATALPTWAAGGWRPRSSVAAWRSAVDRAIVQLHAIRAPTLFDRAAALADAQAWAQATEADFWVALPTYRADLRDGTPLWADPGQVQALLMELRGGAVPAVTGILWYRLGFQSDDRAWSAATLGAVVRGAFVAGEARIDLVPVEPHLWDIAAVNTGQTDVRVTTVDLTGRLPGPLDTVASIGACVTQGGAVLDCGRMGWLGPGQRRMIGYLRTTVDLSTDPTPTTGGPRHARP